MDVARKKTLGFYSLDPSQHTVLEDSQGLLTGALVCGLGFYLLGRWGC